MHGCNGMEPQAPHDRPKPTPGVPRGVMRFASVGVELAAAVGGGCLLGYWFDRHFGTGFWGLLVGAAVGIVGGLYNVIRPALREMAVKAEQERKGHGDRSGPEAGP